jgi:hypothetical protein
MRPTWLIEYVPTPETLRDMLQLVGVEVDSKDLEQLSPMEGLVVADWAVRVHLKASDNPLMYRPKPYILSFLQVLHRNSQR